MAEKYNSPLHPAGIVVNQKSDSNIADIARPDRTTCRTIKQVQLSLQILTYFNGQQTSRRPPPTTPPKRNNDLFKNWNVDSHVHSLLERAALNAVSWIWYSMRTEPPWWSEYAEIWWLSPQQWEGTAIWNLEFRLLVQKRCDPHFQINAPSRISPCLPHSGTMGVTGDRL